MKVMTVHAMTLNSPWFELMKSGQKRYEGRRRTSKTSSISPGDTIVMTHHTNNTLDPYTVYVEEVIAFPTFQHALEMLPLSEVLPVDGITVDKGVAIYHQYVSQATQEKDGIVMIKVTRTEP